MCRRTMAVPSGQAVHAAGEPHGITAYGTEAMHVLRAEKGYIIVGQETDGTVIPGGSRARLDDRHDQAGLRRQAFADAARHAARATASSSSDCSSPEVLEEGAQLVADAMHRCRSLGHVTSAYWSETLRRPIALALLSGGRARIGQTLYVPMADRTIAVRVTEPVSLRPGGPASAWLIARIRSPHPLPRSPDCPAVQLAALPPATRLIIRGDASVLAMIGLQFRTPVAPQRSAAMLCCGLVPTSSCAGIMTMPRPLLPPAASTYRIATPH